MRKVRIIKMPDWQRLIEQKFFKIIDDIFDIFGTTKNLIITLLICYSLIFLIAGFAWAVIDYKMLAANN